MKVLVQEQSDAARISDANMLMIRQQIFYIHTERNTNIRIKFKVLSVAPEKDKGQVEIYVR